jgi:hypothetical protein
MYVPLKLGLQLQNYGCDKEQSRFHEKMKVLSGKMTVLHEETK